LGCGLLVLPHVLVWCPRARRGPHWLGSGGRLGEGFIGNISVLLALTIILVRIANRYRVLRIFAATSSSTISVKKRYFAFHGVFGLFELLCKIASQTTTDREFRACATIRLHSRDDMYLSQRKKAVEDALRRQFSWRLQLGLSKHCTGERESAQDKVG
jgi:hypothetical protein